MWLEIGLALLGLDPFPLSPNQGENKMNKNIYYRTTDGRADFGFSVEQQNDGSLKAFILSMPSYGSRDTGLHATHRLTDGGRYYICWNSKLYNEGDLRSVIALWSDATQTYIRTGETIDGQMRRRR